MFNVGDKVRVKVGFRKIPGTIRVGDIKVDYEGKVMKVLDVSKDNNGTIKFYRLEDKIDGITGSQWAWSPEWLESVDRPEDIKFREALLAQ